MTRVTVRDPEKTVSFHGDDTLVRALVAACAAEPELLEDLLVAAEPYRRGVASRIVRALIRHDLAVMRQHTTPLFDVFEVHNESTHRLAHRPEADGLVVVDLNERTVRGLVPSGRQIAARGALKVDRIGSDLDRETVYVLSGDWRVDVQTQLQPEREQAYA